jgi:hypothetical protein
VASFECFLLTHLRIEVVVYAADADTSAEYPLGTGHFIQAHRAYPVPVVTDVIKLRFPLEKFLHPFSPPFC